MNRTAPLRAEARLFSSLVLGAVAVVIAGIIAMLSYQAISPPFLLVDSPIEVSAAKAAVADPQGDLQSELPQGDNDQAATEADGILLDGATVFDDQYPGVANLDSALLEALRAGAADAAYDGVEVRIESGWRSPAYQDQLLREAVSEYGSEEEAARWVATADKSAHVSGSAVDVGSLDAILWLSEHGASYGLCQTYVNEPWHYELNPGAIDDGCPAAYADPTHDPRMQG